MAQHDYVIANGTGAAVRSDLNNALAAIVSNNSGATEPATMYAYQWWADTSTGLLKLRNAANNAWITLRELDGTLTIEDGTASSPGLAFADDLNTGIYSPSADQLGITTGGTVRLTTTTTGITSALPVDVPLGTASAPTVTFTGDLDTGIYSPGANQVAISTNGTQRLTVDTAATTSTLPVVLPLGAVGTPSITFTGDLNTGIWSPAADTIAASTGGSERLRIDSSGRVGIGTTSPGRLLQVSNTSADPFISILGAASNNGGLLFGDNASDAVGQIRYDHSVDAMYFATNSSERARIDSSGRLLVGTSSARSTATLGTNYQALIEKAGDYAGFSIVGNKANNQGSYLVLGKSRGTTAGAVNAVVADDVLGYIGFEGTDGTNLIRAADISVAVDGTPGTNDMPGRLVFSTTADGASSPTERMRINNAGKISINNTTGDSGNTGFITNTGGDTYITAAGARVLYVNRKSDDGVIVSLRQDDIEEGTISVSGTTVSYNGAHLSRWSQLPGIDPHDKDQRPEILRGTVMSNLDEMCDWIDPESGDAQDNEQLNKTKISDVEGDKNVAGIFQSWDNDDDTWVNDYYLAMTGDFIIRIAEGVTVERGDLLMSAGDGTAKPQDDDIIRSKTIAKVTSTNVSCTYDDGSYCVPCVLMAC